MSPSTILITGASRGLGAGLVELYLSKPDHTVIAANRNLSASKTLSELPTAAGSKLIVVKLDAAVEADASAAVTELEKQGIEHLDLVIANAGTGRSFPRVRDLKIPDLQENLAPNVFGVVWLYQATRGMLGRAEKGMFVTMGSIAGSIGDQPPIPNSAYAPTKAMVHWFTKRINEEEEKIAAWVIHPGWVQTDMGNAGAQSFGIEQAPVTLSDSVVGIEKLIGEATKETHGGRMWDYEGKVVQW